MGKETEAQSGSSRRGCDHPVSASKKKKSNVEFGARRVHASFSLLLVVV